MVNIASLLNQAGKVAGSATKNVLPTQKKVTTPTVTKPKATTSGLSSIGNMVGTMTGNALNAIKPETINQVSQFAQVPQITPQPVQQPQQNYDAQIKSLIDSLGKIQQPTIAPYQSQYDDDIKQLMGTYKNRQPFAFDAKNNPTILANQSLAADGVAREMARKNMLDSTVTSKQMAEAIAQVFAVQAPALAQQAYSQWGDQGNDMLQEIQLLQGLKNQGYDEYMNNAKLGIDQQNNTKNDIYKAIDLISGLNQQNQSNAIQKANLTGYLNPFEGETIDPSLAKYSGNYAQYAKDFANDNDPSNDYLISQLNKASTLKMFNDPKLLNQYGDQYKTVQQKARDFEAEIAQQQAELAANPNSYENQKKILELEKMKEEVGLLSTYGPQEAQAKIKQFESVIARNNAAATASYASANKSNKEAATSGTTTNNMKYKDYFDEGMKLKQSGNFDSTSGMYIKKYTDDQIFDWANGLAIDEESKANLIDDLGLQQIIDNRIKAKRYSLLGG